MKKKKTTKLPFKMIILTVIFVVIVLAVFLTPNAKEKEEVQQFKQIQIEAAKEGEALCIRETCRDYVGFKYDKANDKCYCYNADGVAIEGSEIGKPAAYARN